MFEGIKNKRVLITGASSAIGGTMAELFAEYGAVVGIHYNKDKKNADKVREKIRRQGGKAELFKADLLDSAVPGRLVRRFTDKFGGIDVLINNAGAGIHIAPLVELSDEDIAACVATNLTGVMYGCRRVAPLLKEQAAGTIINISSICDQQAWPGFSIYGAAKAGLLSFSNHLHVELREFGVRVTCLTPSWGDTDFTAALGWEPKPEDVRCRMTQPEELGEIVAQVCELPAHLVMPTLMVLPLVQEIVPF